MLKSIIGSCSLRLHGSHRLLSGGPAGTWSARGQRWWTTGEWTTSLARRWLARCGRRAGSARRLDRERPRSFFRALPKASSWNRHPRLKPGLGLEPRTKAGVKLGSLAPPQAASAQDTAPALIHHQRHTTTHRWPRLSGLSYGPPCASSPSWCAGAADAGASTRCRWSTP